jgi:hypothetical protein
MTILKLPRLPGVGQRNANWHYDPGLALAETMWAECTMSGIEDDAKANVLDEIKEALESEGYDTSSWYEDFRITRLPEEEETEQ